MRVGQRVDRDNVWFQLRQGLLVIGEAFGALQRFRQLLVGNPARADADHLVIRDARVGERMRHPHVAEPDDENPFPFHAFLRS